MVEKLVWRSGEDPQASPIECGGCTPINPAPRRLRQEDCEFEASVGYI
jgi:hypothetical protein